MARTVLHVVDSPAPVAGSVAILLPGLCRALRNLGISSRLFVESRAGAECWSEAQVPVETGTAQTMAGAARDCDVVHIHGLRGAFLESAAAALRRISVPTIVSPLGGLRGEAASPGGWMGRIRTRLRERRVVRTIDRAVVVNDAEYEALQPVFSPDRLLRLGYGLDAEQYPVQRRASSQDQPLHTLLLLGPVDPREGIVPLLKSFAEMAMQLRTWQVVLAGPQVGDWRKIIEAAVRRKGGAERIRFVEADTPEAQRQWLAQADVLASCSLGVRCPVSVLQAAAMGVPVLATRPASASELGENIRTCPPTRAGIREALRSLLSMSPAERQQQADRASEAVRTCCDWSAVAPRFRDIYETSL